MVSSHPFQILFESFGRQPVDHAEKVNREAYQTLLDVLTVPIEATGRCVLLRAPRAGYGKTHLLSRLQNQLVGSHEFISLQPSSGSQITAKTVIEDAVRRLTRTLPASGGLTAMDLLVRKLFAFALQPLVRSGEVPCQDRDGALGALRNRPIETFDFHHPNAVTAQWARENYEVLGPRLCMEIAQQCGIPVRDVTFWLDSLFQFASTPLDHPARMQTLAQSVLGTETSEGIAMDRLEAVLGMIASQQRVVLVADELEGFSADETAALRLSAFIGSLRQSVDRLDVILSLNQDIWESAFLPRLSGGLADRLSEVLVELKPMTEEEMIALLDSRAPGLGAQVWEHIDTQELHARSLIRAAGEAWMNAARARSNQVAEASPSPVSAAPVVAKAVEEDLSPSETADPFEIADDQFPTEAEPPQSEDQSPEPDSPFTLAAAEENIQEEAALSPNPSPFEAMIDESPAPSIEENRTAEEDDDPFTIVSPATFESTPQPSPFQAVADELPAEESRSEAHTESSEESAEVSENEIDRDSEESSPKPSELAGDQKRVDDLLRQFRERYGRGSL